MVTAKAAGKSGLALKLAGFNGGIKGFCKGIGKTADGRYDCAACHGTGKYQEENKKAE